MIKLTNEQMIKQLQEENEELREEKEQLRNSIKILLKRIKYFKVCLEKEHV